MTSHLRHRSIVQLHWTALFLLLLSGLIYCYLLAFFGEFIFYAGFLCTSFYSYLLLLVYTVICTLPCRDDTAAKSWVCSALFRGRNAGVTLLRRPNKARPRQRRKRGLADSAATSLATSRPNGPVCGHLNPRPGGGLSHLRHGGGGQNDPPPSNSKTTKARRPGDTAIDSS